MRASADRADRHRILLEERLPRPRGEHRDALFGVRRRLGQHLLVIPVVADFVIVPHHDLRDLRLKSPVVLVEAVVEVIAAILVERFGDFRLRRRDDVLPHRPVVQRHFLAQRTVGIDRVADVHE